MKRECIPVHASAVVYNGVGILMAGWAHCGKTAALLGFASKGAEYVGEEWVLLSGNGQRMQGLVRPLELSHRHVASLPHVRSAVKPDKPLCVPWNRRSGRIAEDDFRRKDSKQPCLPDSAEGFGCSRGPAEAERGAFSHLPGQDSFRGRPGDKIFLFLSHEDHKIEVEPIAPFEMARRLAFLVQHELTPLLRHYAAYRFAFPGQRNELIENVAGYSFGMLSRALKGKETYIVRLPYPHAFPELYKTIQPLCKPTTAATPESLHTLA